MNLVTVVPEEDPDAVPRWAADTIIAAGRRMDELGLVRATAGNISVRLDERTFALTTSGQHKGFLDADGIMGMTLDGAPTTEGRPPAEAGLHAELYRLMPHVGAIVHGHSVPATVLSMAHRGEQLLLTDYEVLKAFGHRTHETTIAIPLFDNAQDIPALVARIEPTLAGGGAEAGYVLRGHGAYAWGAEMSHALARLEALEFPFECELEKRRIER